MLDSYRLTSTIKQPKKKKRKKKKRKHSLRKKTAALFPAQQYRGGAHSSFSVSRGSMHAIKIPVLIARQKVDMNIAKTISLPHRVEETIDIEWEVSSLSCRFLLPSRYLFVHGMLTADIQYVAADEGRKVYSLKTSIPFHKIEPIAKADRLRQPKVARKAEYFFRESPEVVQREYYAVKHEEPICELNAVHITSLEQVKKASLYLQINAVLFFRIFQSRLMEVLAPVNKNESL
ncbi:hypothetical protein ACKE5C_17740 [Aneurinibacillus thermoaerophilus]|uniref:Uncharacterized protein n=1 Tax=Aneurinibacillus thermoaerophilus TaxID=143495 RepID=A0ABX8YB17_ANETH|nr:hypothetical protein [Aneurinibacillus thermoaerophilus]QYY42611.1 hypothetical protein K3F53_17550 [Aneurinibacillus thermoaerophilus]